MFDVALTELLADGVFHEERWMFGDDDVGERRSMQFYELEDETVWGATARILTAFLSASSASRSPATGTTGRAPSEPRPGPPGE